MAICKYICIICYTFIFINKQISIFNNILICILFDLVDQQFQATTQSTPKKISLYSKTYQNYDQRLTCSIVGMCGLDILTFRGTGQMLNAVQRNYLPIIDWIAFAVNVLATKPMCAHCNLMLNINQLNINQQNIG